MITEDTYVLKGRRSMNHSIYAPFISTPDKRGLSAARERRARDRSIDRRRRLLGNIAMLSLTLAMLAAAAFPALLTALV